MKQFKYLLLSCMLAFAWGAFAAVPIPNKDYRLVIPPQPTETGNKIEVIEFFYYGCPHCYDLEPYLKKWMGNAPKDVAFRRIPAVFRDDWIPLTKTFYTLEALGEVNRLQSAVYEAIHVKQINLNNEQTLLDWMEQHGVDRKKFADVYNSFSVINRVEFAKKLTRFYGVEGTPSLVVDGKYLTGPGMTGSHESAFQVLDQLIDKARQERASRR
ncbi:MAG TPA: thiol:disulfide interchange protein DsbA/DsbL [Burkholderiales bacterium]|nr:thiol:disulfide interchange protein DsbA/DsbL [Burkholderiales bacterium]